MARELALTGRKFGAEEARDMGFISRVIKGGRKEVVGKSVILIWRVSSRYRCRVGNGEDYR